MSANVPGILLCELSEVSSVEGKGTVPVDGLMVPLLWLEKLLNLPVREAR